MSYPVRAKSSMQLPMCSSRKQGGEKPATIGLDVKVGCWIVHPRAKLSIQCHVSALAHVYITRILH